MPARGGERSGDSGGKKGRLRALLVEPDEEYAALVEQLMGRMGGEAERVGPDEALGAARGDGHTVALVDAEAVTGSGQSVLRELREGTTLPMIALSRADSSEEEVRRVMEQADFELVRPFSPRRFMAAVRAVVHRGRVGPGLAGGGGELVVGRLALDRGRLQGRVDGRLVTLSPREFSLLYVLASRPGVALTRDELAAEAWGWQRTEDTRAVDNVVARLRVKLGDDGTRPELLLTERGVGYRLGVE